MKQIFLILSIVPFLFGCVQTREQRGAEIAKSEMMKRLYDADSYEPIETHIDSAYTSIYTDLAVIRAAHDLIELNAEEKRTTATSIQFRKIIGCHLERFERMEQLCQRRISAGQRRNG